MKFEKQVDHGPEKKNYLNFGSDVLVANDIVWISMWRTYFHVFGHA